MKPLGYGISSYSGKSAFAVLFLVVVAGAAFAVDGILTNGGRSSSKSSYSTLKKDLKMSLHSGFTFHDNRNIGSLKAGSFGHVNSVMSLQKGNVTLYLPTRTKSLTNRFRTPSAPVVR
jgi:hypothetical protein